MTTLDEIDLTAEVAELLDSPWGIPTAPAELNAARELDYEFKYSVEFLRDAYYSALAGQMRECAALDEGVDPYDFDSLDHYSRTPGRAHWDDHAHDAYDMHSLLLDLMMHAEQIQEAEVKWMTADSLLDWGEETDAHRQAWHAAMKVVAAEAEEWAEARDAAHWAKHGSQASNR